MNWTMVWENVVRPIIEIGILTSLIYPVLYFLRGSRGVFVLAGVLSVLIGLSLLAEWLEFQVIGRLMGESSMVLAVAIIVIFQPELRRAFAKLGSLFLRSRHQREVIGEIVAAAVHMSRRKCGALIVLERRIGMRALEEDDGVRLDIKVNALVLESIFYPNSPLHDGAVIIRDDRIVAARVILPLTRNENPDVKQLGTRHRAAVGVSEETDAVAVVVSEETGIISICVGGELKRDLPSAQIEEELNKRMLNNSPDSVSLTRFTVDDSRDPHHTEDLR